MQIERLDRMKSDSIRSDQIKRNYYVKKTTRERERVDTYEIEGTGEATLDLNELVVAVRRVTAEGEDVVDAVGLDVVEGVVYLVNRHVGASEMHHSLNADHVLHPVSNLESEIRG